METDGGFRTTVAGRAHRGLRDDAWTESCRGAALWGRLCSSNREPLRWPRATCVALVTALWPQPERLITSDGAIRVSTRSVPCTLASRCTAVPFGGLASTATRTYVWLSSRPRCLTRSDWL